MSDKTPYRPSAVWEEQVRRKRAYNTEKQLQALRERGGLLAPPPDPVQWTVVLSLGLSGIIPKLAAGPVLLRDLPAEQRRAEADRMRTELEELLVRSFVNCSDAWLPFGPPAAFDQRLSNSKFATSFSTVPWVLLLTTLVGVVAASTYSHSSFEVPVLELGSALRDCYHSKLLAHPHLSLEPHG